MSAPTCIASDSLADHKAFKITSLDFALNIGVFILEFTQSMSKFTIPAFMVGEKQLAQDEQVPSFPFSTLFMIKQLHLELWTFRIKYQSFSLLRGYVPGAASQDEKQQDNHLRTVRRPDKRVDLRFDEFSFLGASSKLPSSLANFKCSTSAVSKLAPALTELVGDSFSFFFFAGTLKKGEVSIRRNSEKSSSSDFYQISLKSDSFHALLSPISPFFVSPLIQIWVETFQSIEFMKIYNRDAAARQSVSLGNGDAGPRDQQVLIYRCGGFFTCC